MSSELSETIPVQERRPPEELGGDITRACISLLQHDLRFAKVLTDGRIFEDVSTALAQYLEKLENAHPSEMIRAVRVTVNDYLAELGIGLMSCRVEPLNRDMDSMILQDEEKYPTIGVIPEVINPHGGTATQPRVCSFGVDQGGEELTALTNNLCMRGYLPGEHPRHPECVLQPLRQGTIVLVPQKSSIGVRVKFFDETNLFRSRFYRNVFPITHDELRTTHMSGAPRLRADSFEPGQVYFCRYLTKQAVAEALGL